MHSLDVVVDNVELRRAFLAVDGWLSGGNAVVIQASGELVDEMLSS